MNVLSQQEIEKLKKSMAARPPVFNYLAQSGLGGIEFKERAKELTPAKKKTVDAERYYEHSAWIAGRYYDEAEGILTIFFRPFPTNSKSPVVIGIDKPIEPGFVKAFDAGIPSTYKNYKRKLYTRPDSQGAFYWKYIRQYRYVDRSDTVTEILENEERVVTAIDLDTINEWDEKTPTTDINSSGNKETSKESKGPQSKKETKTREPTYWNTKSEDKIKNYKQWKNYFRAELFQREKTFFADGRWFSHETSSFITNQITSTLAGKGSIKNNVVNHFKHKVNNNLRDYASKRILSSKFKQQFNSTSEIASFYASGNKLPLSAIIAKNGIRGTLKGKANQAGVALFEKVFKSTVKSALNPRTLIKAAEGPEAFIAALAKTEGQKVVSFFVKGGAKISKAIFSDGKIISRFSTVLRWAQTQKDILSPEIVKYTKIALKLDIEREKAKFLRNQKNKVKNAAYNALKEKRLQQKRELRDQAEKRNYAAYQEWRKNNK